MSVIRSLALERHREYRKRHLAVCSCGSWMAVGSRYAVEEDCRTHDSAGGVPDNHIVRIARRRWPFRTLPTAGPVVGDREHR